MVGPLPARHRTWYRRCEKAGWGNPRLGSVQLGANSRFRRPLGRSLLSPSGSAPRPVGLRYTDDMRAQEPAHRRIDVSGDAYEARWEQLAAAGQDIHGEARFALRFPGSWILDAGCGTGRVGRELARHGRRVVGVDVDPAVLETARQRSLDVDWRLGDLADVDLDRSFDLAIMAGNVMIFVAAGTARAVVANVARQLAPGGRLIAGFQIMPGRLSLAEYDACCDAAGLALDERWATWDRAPWPGDGHYAVSVHRKPAP